MQTCGNCRHWARNPANPQDVARVEGECRQAPPAVFAVLIGTNRIHKVTEYPIIPPAFPACGQFEPAAEVN